MTMKRTPQEVKDAIIDLFKTEYLYPFDPVKGKGNITYVIARGNKMGKLVLHDNGEIDLSFSRGTKEFSFENETLDQDYRETLNIILDL